MATLTQEDLSALVLDLNAEEVKKELLSKYPTKVARKRAKQIVINEVDPDSCVPEIASNVRTIPGIITQRGCTYAGCKGVVLGPTRDIVNITHGPIGCGFYSWLTRRNQTRPNGPEDHNFMTYCFSTDMQEEQIIFGGEKKLKQAVQEAYDLFKPKAISIFSTCPVGLIGDDVHAVAREMKEKLGDQRLCLQLRGLQRGESVRRPPHRQQRHLHPRGGPGRHREGRQVQDQHAGGIQHRRRCLRDRAPLRGLRHHADCHLQRQLQLRLLCQLPHRGPQSHHVPPLHQLRGRDDGNEIRHPLDQGQLYRGRGHGQVPEEDRRLFRRPRTDGDGWRRSSPGRCPRWSGCGRSQARCAGKTAMLFVGGSRAHHYQELFREIGMETIAAGYEFAHRDDYEGRRVLPNLKVDADSRNIEELHVEPDPDRFRPRLSEADLARLEKAGIKLSEYEGMMAEMDSGALVIDDISQFETERLIEIYRPDIICAGIKEKYAIQKSGVPMKQLHSYDSGGPYAGFKGAVNFYREIDRMVNSKVWKYLKAPWQENPELAAKYVWE